MSPRDSSSASSTRSAPSPCSSPGLATPPIATTPSDEETSDYPRNTPSPELHVQSATASQRCTSTKNSSVSWDPRRSPRGGVTRLGGAKVGISRRSTAPSDSDITLQNLQVSLAKLPLDALRSHNISCDRNNRSKSCDCHFSGDNKRPADSKDANPHHHQTKKVKLENERKEEEGSNHHQCKSHRVLPVASSKVLENGVVLKAEQDDDSKFLPPFSRSQHSSNDRAKKEQMKIEIAKIDRILSSDLLNQQDKESNLLMFSQTGKVGYQLSDKIEYQANVKLEMCASSFDKEVFEREKDLEKSMSECSVVTPGESPVETLAHRTSESVTGPSENKERDDREYVKCKWKGCGHKVEARLLLDHLDSVHVAVQTVAGGRVQCLWLGCKVFGAWSSSGNWLEKHCTSHVGAKPFPCIVDNCKQRFGTQISLSRHVNSHFKLPDERRCSGSKRQDPHSTPTKSNLKNKSRCRPRGKSSKASTNVEIFDVGIMAGVRDGLAKLKASDQNEAATMPSAAASDETSELKFNISGSEVTFQSQVLARKIDTNGIVKLLLTWHPHNVLADEWVPQTEYVVTKKVFIRQLPPSARNKIEASIFGQRNKTKSRRKTGPDREPPTLS